MKTCKDCSNFLGGGDWNLCCKNPPKDQVGWCGFLCYEDTEACKNFKPKLRIKLKPDKPEYWQQSVNEPSKNFDIWPDIGWVSCKDCIFSEDCNNKEDRDGCCFGEEEEN